MKYIVTSLVDPNGMDLFGTTDGNFDYVVNYPWSDHPDKAAIWYAGKVSKGALSGFSSPAHMT